MRATCKRERRTMAKARRSRPKSKTKTDLGLSADGDLCGNCGSPLIVCPGTIRRFVRCCGACTHRTQVDVDYEDKFKPKARVARRPRRPSSS